MGTLVRTNRGLGFSITGGVDNPSTPGYTDIYISRLADGGPAQRDGGLEVGDRLVCVKNLPPGELPAGDFWLSDVTHDEAAQALRQSGPSDPEFLSTKNMEILSIYVRKPEIRKFQ